MTLPSVGGCSARRFVVVVSGPSASGKSTLAPQLAERLNLPLLAKDTVKEVLLGQLGATDVTASRRIGQAAIAVMLELAKACPAVVLESVWHRSLAGPDIAGLDADVVEVFCRCPPDVLERRYRSRAHGRATGHFDAERPAADLWNPDTTEPVAGGWPVIEVDTTTAVDLDALAHLVGGHRPY